MAYKLSIQRILNYGEALVVSATSYHAARTAAILLFPAHLARLSSKFDRIESGKASQSITRAVFFLNNLTLYSHQGLPLLAKLPVYQGSVTVIVRYAILCLRLSQ